MSLGCHCLIIYSNTLPTFQWVNVNVQCQCRLRNRFFFIVKIANYFCVILTLSVPEPVTVKNRPSSATKPACARISGNPDSPWSPCSQFKPLLGYRNSTKVSFSPQMIATFLRCHFELSDNIVFWRTHKWKKNEQIWIVNEYVVVKKKFTTKIQIYAIRC